MKFKVISIFIVVVMILGMGTVSLAEKPQWNEFSYNFTGVNGFGNLVVSDENAVFDYVLAKEFVNGTFSNGDMVIINAVNRDGNVVKSMIVEVMGLINPWNGFGYTLIGFNGEGKITIVDQNDSIDFVLQEGVLNGRLVNGATITVNATSNGQVIDTKELTIEGLAPVTQTGFTFIYNSSYTFRFRNGYASEVKAVAQVYNGPIVFDGTVPANQTIFFDVDSTAKPTVIIKYYDMYGNPLGTYTK